jgi:hypothetical protein
MYESYEKSGRAVWVRQDLKNRQKEFCMCWECWRFKPQAEDKGCEIIKDVLNLAAQKTIVLPVWECPSFISIKK